MTNSDDIDEAIARVLVATTANFEELVTISGLNPATDFRYANLGDIDFSGSNLAGFDFTGAIFAGANFANAKIAGATFSRSRQLDVQLRNAIDAAEVLGVERQRHDPVSGPAGPASRTDAKSNNVDAIAIPTNTKATGNAQPRSKRIEGRRSAMIAALGARENVELNKVGGASYQSRDGAIRAVFALSKRHEGPRPHYWYGHSPERRKFLSKGVSSFVVLGCIDRDVAYAIPNKQIDRVLDRLHRTGTRHWHVVLGEVEGGGLKLLIPNERAISLSEFSLVQIRRSPSS